jgi:hypothetical protein
MQELTAFNVRRRPVSLSDHRSRLLIANIFPIKRLCSLRLEKACAFKTRTEERQSSATSGRNTENKLLQTAGRQKGKKSIRGERRPLNEVSLTPSNYTDTATQDSEGCEKSRNNAFWPLHAKI